MARRRLFLVLLFLSLAPGLAAPGALAQEERPKGWLGVLLGELPAPPADADGLESEPGGVRIERIVRGGPADGARLRAGDIVRQVDGQPVESVRDLIAAVGGVEPGTWVTFGVDRRGRDRDVRIRLETRPTDTSRLDLREGWIGAYAIDLPPTLQEHFGAPEGTGVMIAEIDEGGPAHIAGLELGDVVYSVNGVDTGSVRNFASQVRSGGVGNPMEIELMRGGVEIVLEAVVEERPEETDETT